ncbi:MAG: redoxin domain-containing protein [Fimbriimonadaceae bacterium]|nr:MAG: redoxin domain-containing protein [Fimbriimonadaceae bacterium]
MTTLLASAILATASLSPQEDPCLCSPLPSFSLKASDGKTYTQESVVKKNTVVVFLAAGCPHNPKAAKDLNHLKSLLGDKVAMVGMTNMAGDKVKAYAEELGLKFPLISDSKGTVIEKFGATHSLDLALVCKEDRKIGKTWSGYNQTILTELFKELPKHGGPAMKVDLSSFPTARQSGCGF